MYRRSRVWGIDLPCHLADEPRAEYIFHPHVFTISHSLTICRISLLFDDFFLYYISSLEFEKMQNFCERYVFIFVNFYGRMKEKMENVSVGNYCCYCMNLIYDHMPYFTLHKWCACDTTRLFCFTLQEYCNTLNELRLSRASKKFTQKCKFHEDSLFAAVRHEHALRG